MSDSFLAILGGMWAWGGDWACWPCLAAWMAAFASAGAGFLRYTGGLVEPGAMMRWMTGTLPIAWIDTDKLRQAGEYVSNLDEDDRAVVQTWLIFEGLARIIYYVLIFLAVFLLGRRIIQAMIAGFREARSSAV